MSPSMSRGVNRGINRLIRLYPRAWRERYGEEYAELLAELSLRRQRFWLIFDIFRGALDAHLQRRFGMRRFLADPALRRGLWDGLIVTGMIAVLVVLTNVVFPGGPDESDDDPEYLIQYLITLAVLAGLLIAIGVRGAGRGRGVAGGMKAGGLAGAVIALGVTLTFIAVNNAFLDIVSRQHDKRVAFAASGWSSMRAFLTVTQLRGALVLIPALAVVGAVLGLLGGTARRLGGGARPPETPARP